MAIASERWYTMNHVNHIGHIGALLTLGISNLKYLSTRVFKEAFCLDSISNGEQWFALTLVGHFHCQCNLISLLLCFYRDREGVRE